MDSNAMCQSLRHNKKSKDKAWWTVNELQDEMRVGASREEVWDAIKEVRCVGATTGSMPRALKQEWHMLLHLQQRMEYAVAPAENGNMRIIAVGKNGCLKAGMKLINSGPTKSIHSPVICVKILCNIKEYICVDLLFVHREDHEGPCTKHLRYECWQRKPGAVGRDSIRNCTTEQNSFGCKVPRQILHDNPRQARPNQVTRASWPGSEQ